MSIRRRRLLGAGGGIVAALAQSSLAMPPLAFRASAERTLLQWSEMAEALDLYSSG